MVTSSGTKTHFRSQTVSIHPHFHPNSHLQLSVFLAIQHTCILIWKICFLRMKKSTATNGWTAVLETESPLRCIIFQEWNWFYVLVGSENKSTFPKMPIIAFFWWWNFIMFFHSFSTLHGYRQSTLSLKAYNFATGECLQCDCLLGYICITDSDTDINGIHPSNSFSKWSPKSSQVKSCYFCKHRAQWSIGERNWTDETYINICTSFRCSSGL